ncbi:MAG: hypothetical protein U0U66_07095 [Cytophagaceae bacterium]
MKLNIFHWAILLISSISCQSSIDKSSPVLDSSPYIEHPINDSTIISNIFNTPSSVIFPYNTDSSDNNYGTYDLSGIQLTKLTNIPFQPIETIISDAYKIDDKVSDTTFNLTDSSYISTWIIISKQPEFIVINSIDMNTGYAYLVTLSKKLLVIDAIRSLYSEGNDRYNAERNVTIYQNLSLTINGYYNVIEDIEKQIFISEKSIDYWYIDNQGYFKKK